MQNHSVRAGFALEEAPSLLVSGITEKSKPSLRNFQQEHVWHISVFVGFVSIPTVKKSFGGCNCRLFFHVSLTIQSMLMVSHWLVWTSVAIADLRVDLSNHDSKHEHQCCNSQWIDEAMEHHLCIILRLGTPPLFIGPCTHRDRDYRIRSNFCKFYIIRTGFFGESV